MQGSKLYVGNLDQSVTNQDLQDLFSEYGEVKEVNIMEGKGFGFVEMSNPSEAETAKEALDGSDCKGLTLKVDEARPPRRREGGGGPPGRREGGGRPPGRREGGGRPPGRREGGGRPPGRREGGGRPPGRREGGDSRRY